MNRKEIQSRLKPIEQIGRYGWKCMSFDTPLVFNPTVDDMKRRLEFLLKQLTTEEAIFLLSNEK